MTVPTQVGVGLWSGILHAMERRRALRRGIMLMAITVGIVLVIAPPSVEAVTGGSHEVLETLVDLPWAGVTVREEGSITGLQWTSVVPWLVASELCIVQPEDVVAGYERVLTPSQGGEVIVAAVALSRPILSAELKYAQESSEKYYSPLELGSLPHAVGLRTILSRFGSPDQPGDVVLLASRFLLVRISATGAAADGRLAVELAGAMVEQLQRSVGYESLPSETVVELADAIKLVTFVIAGLSALVGVFYLNRQQKRRHVVSNWSKELSSEWSAVAVGSKPPPPPPPASGPSGALSPPAPLP